MNHQWMFLVILPDDWLFTHISSPSHTPLFIYSAPRKTTRKGRKQPKTKTGKCDRKTRHILAEFCHTTIVMSQDSSHPFPVTKEPNQHTMKLPSRNINRSYDQSRGWKGGHLPIQRLQIHSLPNSESTTRHAAHGSPEWWWNFIWSDFWASKENAQMEFSNNEDKFSSVTSLFVHSFKLENIYWLTEDSQFRIQFKRPDLFFHFT